MKNAVIFDVDGTLVDSVGLHAEAWHEAFHHFGFEIPTAAIRTQIGKGGDKLMPFLLSKQDLEEKGEQIEKYRSELFMRKYMPKVRSFPRVRELFERIRADRKKIALASSSDKKAADDSEKDRTGRRCGSLRNFGGRH